MLRLVVSVSDVKEQVEAGLIVDCAGGGSRQSEFLQETCRVSTSVPLREIAKRVCS